VRTGLDDLDNIAALERLAGYSTHGRRYVDYVQFTRADSHFHTALVEMTNNAFLATSWERLDFHVHVSRLYAGAGVIDFEEAQVEHRSHPAGTINRNLKELIIACQNHIDNSEKRLERLCDDR
jgi:DNA-binding GntR family transcriptional regulator